MLTYKVIYIIFPDPLGQLILVLRLIKSFKKFLNLENPDYSIVAIVDKSFKSYLVQSECFAGIMTYDEDFSQVINGLMVIDLAGYEFSEKIRNEIVANKKIYRDKDKPSTIVHNNIFYTCPALNEKNGWMLNKLNPAILCELPLLNLALNYEINSLKLIHDSECLISYSNVVRNTDGEICILPLGRMSSKNWPIENWRCLINYYSKNNISCKVILGLDNVYLYDFFKDLPIRIVVTNDLKELVDELKLCKLVIANDCGPMHVGIYLNLPTIAIFGPTFPECWFIPTCQYQTYVQSNNNLHLRTEFIQNLVWNDWIDCESVILASLSISRRIELLNSYEIE
jgi:hypothetical protein